MQRVAWPMMIVVSEKFVPLHEKNELSAMPVMIPGSAIGSTSRNDTASRPKKRKRCTAHAASPDSHGALRMSEVGNGDENHCVESPSSGQLCTFGGWNA